MTLAFVAANETTTTWTKQSTRQWPTFLPWRRRCLSSSYYYYYFYSLHDIPPKEGVSIVSAIFEISVFSWHGFYLVSIAKKGKATHSDVEHGTKLARLNSIDIEFKPFFPVFSNTLLICHPPTPFRVKMFQVSLVS
jgi:hypothetical protein